MSDIKKLRTGWIGLRTRGCLWCPILPRPDWQSSLMAGIRNGSTSGRPGGAAGAHRIEDVIEGVDVVVSMMPNDKMRQDYSHGEL
jgi:hypothetical protein